jgi:predicted nucleic acid-binding protein
MLLDSFAWMEYFVGTAAGKRVEVLVKGPSTLYTSPIVVAEVYSRVSRLTGATDATKKVEEIVNRCVLVPADESIGREAGAIHAQQRPVVKDFGMADALIVATARSRGVKVLTGDPHILALPEGVPI